MKKVFMVHGFKGEPNGGWRPWLMGELGRKDIWAISLGMPTPYTPKKDEWVNEISRAVNNYPDDEIFLIGHSLGVPAILQYLVSLGANKKISGVVLVSGPSQKLEVENLESQLRALDHFFEPKFDFEKIKKSCGKFAIIHGDNDSKVPFSHGEELSKNLNCKLIVVPNGGHLGGSEGWDKLPQALQELNEMMK